MDSPGYIALSRLGAQLRSTQVLANNLANADTPGFRAERAVFAEFLQPRAAGDGDAIQSRSLRNALRAAFRRGA